MSGKESWLNHLSECLAHHPHPPPGWTRLRTKTAPEPNCPSPSPPSLANVGGNGADPEIEATEMGRDGDGVGGGDGGGDAGGGGEGEEEEEEDTSDVARVVREFRRGGDGYADLSLKEKIDLLIMLLHDALATRWEGLGKTGERRIGGYRMNWHPVLYTMQTTLFVYCTLLNGT